MKNEIVCVHLTEKERASERERVDVLYNIGEYEHVCV